MLFKPPVSTPLLGQDGLVTREWSLYFQSLSTGDTGADLTPTFSGLTGSPTITGAYYYISKYMIYFRVELNGTSASTAGTTYFTFPQNINKNSVIYAGNSTTNIGIGMGLAKTNNRVYTPTWSVTSQIVTITGIIETR